MAARKKTDEQAPNAVDAAPADDTKYVKVKSPLGAVTTVPETIKDALVASGYEIQK